jgi:hypothetical protein
LSKGAWTVADEVYGSDRHLRRFLEEDERPVVLAVRCDERLWSGHAGHLGQHAATARAAALPATAWPCLLSLSKGRRTGGQEPALAKAGGERLSDWARVRVRLARPAGPAWAQWLLIRRSRSKDEQAYDVVFAPAATTLAERARVAGQRWTIEECFEVSKPEVGLGDYEIRSWQALRQAQEVSPQHAGHAGTGLSGCRAGHASPPDGNIG